VGVRAKKTAHDRSQTASVTLNLMALGSTRAAATVLSLVETVVLPWLKKKDLVFLPRMNANRRK
ncbi:hypothetical protein, partial [Candidatus Thiosymbion oneisti]|uniref:hypothetical protein n=1 Tax=Candidatus Thiosymbion oneisti TaxID=589554 RepID=UPI001C403098